MVLDLVARAANVEYHDMPAREARAADEERATALDVPPPPLAHVRDVPVPGPAGELAARAYAASAAPRNLPVVLWLHGGGHTVGSIAVYDSICRRLATLSGCLVVSLDYRLAPEHKFPAAVEDAYAALDWLTRHAGDLGGDARRMAVAGDSAGGNLAAVCALLARDAGLPGLCAQLLVYPAVAPHATHDSHRLFAEGFLLTARSIQWFQEQYLSHEQQREDWRFAPLLAAGHQDLPPAMVMVAGHDPLRDEGIAYAGRLREAGNRVELVNHEGMIHAFWNLGAAVREADRSIARAAAFLRAELDPPQPDPPGPECRRATAPQ